MNIIIVSLLTVKFMADNAKAKAGRKVIEEDVRRSKPDSDHTDCSRPVSCTLSDRSNYCMTWDMLQMHSGHSITTHSHDIYPWKPDKLHVFSIFVLILKHKKFRARNKYANINPGVFFLHLLPV
jgi:hypothetical protein